MASREHELPFLGTRNYLHGTTLFDLLMSLVPANAAVTYKIAAIIRSNRIRVGSEGQAEKPAATLQWKRGDDAGKLEVFPLEPSATLARVAYDERAATESARMEEDALVLPGPTPYSFIATLVPLFKDLLRRRGRTGAGPGQWMFTRLDLGEVPLEGFLPLRLTLDPVSSGPMARASFSAGTGRQGQIYFSWVGSA